MYFTFICGLLVFDFHILLKSDSYFVASMNRWGNLKFLLSVCAIFMIATKLFICQYVALHPIVESGSAPHSGVSIFLWINIGR